MAAAVPQRPAQTQICGALRGRRVVRSVRWSSLVGSQAAGTGPSCVAPHEGDATCALGDAASRVCICSRICITVAEVMIATATRHSVLLIFMVDAPCRCCLPIVFNSSARLAVGCCAARHAGGEPTKQPPCHRSKACRGWLCGAPRGSGTGKIYAHWQDWKCWPTRSAGHSRRCAPGTRHAHRSTNPVAW